MKKLLSFLLLVSIFANVSAVKEKKKNSGGENFFNLSLTAIGNGLNLRDAFEIIKEFKDPKKFRFSLEEAKSIEKGGGFESFEGFVSLAYLASWAYVLATTARGMVDLGKLANNEDVEVRVDAGLRILYEIVKKMQSSLS